MKRNYLLIILLLIGFCSIGQDWVKNQSQLYYYVDGEHVSMTPDYSSLAVYFHGTPAKTVQERFEGKLTERFASGASVSMPEVSMMSSKGVMRIKAAASLTNSRSIDSDEFIEQYDLKEDGAYEVLPSFDVQGTQMWMTKRVNLGLGEGVDITQIQAILENYGATLQKSRLNGSFITLNVESLENQLPLIQELAENNLIRWGEPDFKVEIKKYNDPYYQYQWHLNNTGGVDYSGNFSLTSDVDIDAEEAWTITTGSSNITVAVIDDGMVNHEDFPNLLPGYSPASNGDGSPDYSADPYHGQPCGGLIFAQHNDIGVRGVAPGVNAFSVNIFESSTSNADVADAIIWSVDQGADVLSNSWGYGNCGSNLVASITDAFSYAATSGRNGLGCVILVAAGNDFATCVSYPANLSTVTAVGAVNGQGDKSIYSNSGSTLDITAPSNDVVLNNAGTAIIDAISDMVTTDLPGSDGSYNGEYYFEFGGTSAATPVAAGVACLVLSVDPTLSKSEVENILYTTADDYGPAGFDNDYGNGLVNAYQAVLAAGGSACGLSAPANFSASAIGDNSFNLSWNAVSGAASYTVSVGGNETTVSGTSYSASGLIAGTTYACSVVANCSGGGSGSVSNINVTTTGTTPISCNGTVSSYPYGEGFESGDGWTQAGGDDGDWYRTSGSTPSSGTGPTSAAEGSFYLFLEASTNGSAGQIGNNATAILESPCIDLSAESGATFSFQNHMYGTNVGSLVLQATTNDQTWTDLWSLSGDQGNQWNAVDVSLDAYAGGTVKLRFVGTTGNGWSSDIAIDDLSVTTGSGGGDTEAPSTPTGLAASNIGETTLTISWNASSDNVGVVQYNIFVDGGNIGSVSDLDADITGLTASTTYSMGVQAQDAAGNVSGTATINVTTADPSSGGCSDTTVDSNDFEAGWGIWNDGGSDARRSANDAAYSNGTYSIRLRDNTSTSTMTTDNLDLSSFEELTVSFSYYARSMESGEDFWLQISTDGGSSFSTQATWAQGTDFSNDTRYNESVTITGAFSSTTQVRFRNDASANNDWVYIDDVVIEGCSSAGTSFITRNATDVPQNLEEELSFESIVFYPNPVRNQLSIDGMPESAEVRLMTLSGQIIESGVGLERFDMSRLNNGMYLLQVIIDDEVRVHKIIKE